MPALHKQIGAFLLAGWLTWSCAGVQRTEPASCSATDTAPGCANLGEPFAVDSAGRYVSPGFLRVALQDVAEDSRCPEGAQCVWAGRARVRLALDSAAYSRVVELRTDSATTSTFGHTITLDSLVPHPRLDQTIAKSQYHAWLRVARP